MNEIIVENLCVNFGEKKIFENFSLKIPEGEKLFIMGPSGCGKTTLLRILMGLQAPNGGTVTGVPQKISTVFQEDRLSESFSVLSNIRMVTGKNTSNREILEHLEELGLEQEAKAPVRLLSGGMKRRVALARAVLFGGEVFFLDEAFKALDENNRIKAMLYLKKHTEGKTLIAVTHDLDEAEFFGGKVLNL